MIKKKIAILGSTGSIGTSALDVVSNFTAEFEVIGLSAESNVELLARQARRFRPKVLCIGNNGLARDMKRLSPSGTTIVAGPDGLKEIASRSDIDLLVVTSDNFVPGSFSEKQKISLKINNALSFIRRKFPLDVIVHTKPMYQNFILMNSAFQREISTKGIVLYEKNN